MNEKNTSLISKPPFALAKRKTLLLAGDRLDSIAAKTAVCFIRYRGEDAAVVLAGSQAGRTAGDVLGFGGSIPIVANVEEAKAFRPEVAVVGIAPRGGTMDEALRGRILQCIDAGMDIVNGLHVCLADDRQVRDRCKRSNSRIWDVRHVPDEGVVATGRGCVTGGGTVLLVGTDCSVGKMTVAVELYREALRRGIVAAWAATGQTGMILRERGIAIDAVIGDYMSGAAETLVNFEGDCKEIVFVEGQGSLLHPGYGGVTLALMLGVMPDCMVLVHDLAKKTVKDYDRIKMPSLSVAIRYHQSVMTPFKKVPFAAVALKTAGMSESQAKNSLMEAGRETGLPVGDVIRFGAAEVLDGVVECLGREAGGKGDA
jgi:uncharacterized NAD-dependent epimerase/dehydratase family protein